MVLSDVEETVTIVEVEEDNEDEAVRVSRQPSPTGSSMDLFSVAVLTSRLSKNAQRCCL
jgi:hypothetical protein